jgi:hypothetical protein
MRAELTTEQHGARLLRLMERLQHDPGANIMDCHQVKAAPGVAMLVDPINEDPFVFLPPNRMFIFQSVCGSGTDRLRKRIEAELFFKRTVEHSHLYQGRQEAAPEAQRERSGQG